MTKRALVQKLAHAGRIGAAALVALAVGRFAVAAVETAIAEDQKPPTASTPPPTAPSSSGRARAPVAPPGSAPPSNPGAPVKAQLLVNVGSERSEVFVDGAKVGSSPFVGTISCRAGDKLAIEVVITKGVVHAYERVCEAGTIRVDAAP